jgi:hypothetical protein
MSSRSRCSSPVARRRPSTSGTEVRRGPLLAARHGCTLGLALLCAASRILVLAPPPTHPWPQPWPRPWEAAWTSHELFSARDGAGAASIALVAAGLALTYLVGVDAASMSDASILERLNDGRRQVAAGIGVPVLAAGVGLLLWFATGLRKVLDQLSGGDPLAHATVPAAALLGGLMITAVSLDVSSAFAALSDEFTPNPDTARALGIAGAILGLTGLIGGAVLVAVTTRIAQQARALPRWAVWVSYAVAVLCLSGFWSGGIASVAFALWLIGAVIGVLRVARRTGPAPAVPVQGVPDREVARTPPTATSG